MPRYSNDESLKFQISSQRRMPQPERDWSELFYCGSLGKLIKFLHSHCGRQKKIFVRLILIRASVLSFPYYFIGLFLWARFRMVYCLIIVTGKYHAHENYIQKEKKENFAVFVRTICPMSIRMYHDNMYV